MDDNDRLFQPECVGFSSDSVEHPSDLLYYDQRAGILHLRTFASNARRPRIRRDFIAIAIDGACRNNGYSTARASYGIFFGPDSSLNVTGILPASYRQTNQVAELYALMRALEIVQGRFGDSLQKVVIITDSAYLVNGLTRYTYDWANNGWRDSRGRQLINGSLFRHLHETIDDMTDQDIDVSLWKVPRAWNDDANYLANQAFDT